MAQGSRLCPWGDSRLLRRDGMQPHRNLVFTSVGDHSNVRRWLRGNRDFDLWITYYGDEPGRLYDIADLYNVRRDSKFGNLKFAYDSWPEMFAPYGAVFVADDDLLISGTQISRLFDVRAASDLWILQPAFSPLGKISWPITRAQWHCEFRYTNFVEMTCPLFRKDKLEAFLAVFDPILKGTGTDWWFMQVMGEYLEGKVGIVDAITCINPHDRSKGGVREIDRLQSQDQMTHTWNMVRAKYGVERTPPVEFVKRYKPRKKRWLSQAIHYPFDLYARMRRWAWETKRALESW
jgi:hypothetical protein